MDLQNLLADSTHLAGIEPMPGSPLDGVVSVVWAVGRRCNFACSYCSKEFHDRVSPHRTFDELRTVWNNIKKAMAPRGLVAAIEFTGGEPTLNPDFLEFVRYLNTTQRRCVRLLGGTTNGSESLQYYEQLTEHFDWISFSTHFEWWDEHQFMTMLLDLKRSIGERARKTPINVMVMYEDWSASQVQKLRDIIDSEGIQNLPILVYNVYNSKGIVNKKSHPFDHEAYLQRQGVVTPPKSITTEKAKATSSSTSLIEHSAAIENPDTQLLFDNGSIVPGHSQTLVNLRVNSFPNWKCHAGRDRLFINVDGTVYGGMCRIVEMGNMLSEFQLLEQPVICDGRDCSCMGDVRVKKWK